jgi:hypothetical protein
MGRQDWTEERKLLEAKRQKDRIAAELARRRAASVPVPEGASASLTPAVRSDLGVESPSVPIYELDPKFLTEKNVTRFVAQFSPDTPLDVKLEIAANLFVEHAVSMMEKMTSPQAMVAAAIAIEKMQLLRGLPTEITASVQILVKIGQKAAERGVPLKDILQALYENM